MSITSRITSRNNRLITATILSNTELQDTTLALDFRVSILEENGGDGGKSSIAELEVRVEELEGTTADHDTMIAAMESDVTGSLRKL